MSFRGGKGVIRAWTTRLRYRGKGIGRDLLDGAIRIVKDRCGKDAEVGFAQEHANSTMLLPAMFNGVFRRDEVRAAKALEKALEAIAGRLSVVIGTALVGLGFGSSHSGGNKRCLGIN